MNPGGRGCGPDLKAGGSAVRDVGEILRASGGLLAGHFLLSSGRHSDRYLQLAAPFERPDLAAELAAGLAARVREAGLAPATVLGPALGAVVPGFALAQALGLRFLFCEREEGRFALRRGFRLSAGERVLICENTLTTGGSALEALQLARAHGADVVGVAVYCDRIPQPASVFPVPYIGLQRFELASWPAAECPLCRAGVPGPAKPGSRPGA